MVNCANIDWFFPWPEQALYAVASVFISPDVSSTQLILDLQIGKMSTDSRTYIELPPELCRKVPYEAG